MLNEVQYFDSKYSDHHHFLVFKCKVYSCTVECCALFLSSHVKFHSSSGKITFLFLTI